MRDLEEDVRAALVAEAPDARLEACGPCPQANVDRDLVLLDAVLGQPGPTRLLRIWTNPKCVVISKRLAAQTGLVAVQRTLRPLGAGLAVRASGGTAVVHRPGVLNVSLAQGAQPGDTIAHAYGELTGLLARALRRLGLETTVGRAPGAACDGDHNLLWRGRKLAGTAAVVRRHEGRTARLVHGSLVISGEVGRDLRLIRMVERIRPASPTYRPDAHATVSEALRARPAT